MNKDGTPNTAHTKNPVPLFFIDPSEMAKLQLKDGRLCDLAPTVLKLMDLRIPSEMKGEVLISNKAN